MLTNLGLPCLTRIGCASDKVNTATYRVGVAVELTFGQVDAVLSTLHRIAPDKRVAFMSRLKHLQKQGLSDGVKRPGRGKAGSYSFRDLMRLVIALELVQTGFPPQLAVELVNGSWSTLAYSIYSATHSDEEMDEWQEMPHGPETRDWYWMLTPEVLRDMTEEGLGRFDHMEAILAVPVEEVSERLQADAEIGVFGEGWRMIVLHGTKITKAVVTLVEHQFGYATSEQMRADIIETFKRLGRILEEAPLGGVEEGIANTLESVRKQTVEAMASEARRALYTPPEAVLERQARKILGNLPIHLLAYVQREEFGGKDTPDLKAMTTLMLNGLVVPTIGQSSSEYELSPLGQTVKRLTKDNLAGPDAIAQWRSEYRRQLDEWVQRKIDSLLADDPDNPGDYDTLQRWARYGGQAPFSGAKLKEISRRLRTRGAPEDDPAPSEQTLAERKASDGDNQKA